MSGSKDVVADGSAAEQGASRAAVRRGWLLWLAAIVPAAGGLLLLAGSLDAPIPHSFGFRGDSALFALSFGSVGAYVVTRRPGNRVGAILVAIGITGGILGFLLEYGNVGLIAAPGGLPGAIWVAWLASWFWVPLVIFAGWILLSVYPDGRFVSRRWRTVALLGVAIELATLVAVAFSPGPMTNFSFVENPAGILPRWIRDVLFVALPVASVVTLAACAASLIARYRVADREARQQLKWFALSAVALAAAGPFGFYAGQPGEVVVVLAMTAMPLAIGMAVLRYGLYEIDTVINRALVYGLLTAILAGLYTASIGLMQRVSKALTGTDSDAAIVLTTLIVVTAFTPVKGRLQHLVDQRFKENRDPATRLDEFVHTVTDAISPLDPQKTLSHFLRTVVEACDLPGGRIELERPGDTAWSASVGEAPVDLNGIALTAPRGRGTVHLSLSPNRRTGSLSARDRAAVERALAAVVAELP